MSPSDSRARTSARALLRRCFATRGYVRSPNRDRLEEEGAQVYKKGSEVRLVVGTAAELAAVRRALRSVGLRPARSFKKNAQYVQPVYGAEAVKWFTRE